MPCRNNAKGFYAEKKPAQMQIPEAANITQDSKEKGT